MMDFERIIFEELIWLFKSSIQKMVTVTLVSGCNFQMNIQQFKDVIFSIAPVPKASHENLDLIWCSKKLYSTKTKI